MSTLINRWEWTVNPYHLTSPLGTARRGKSWSRKNLSLDLGLRAELLLFLDTARRAKSWSRKNLSSDLGLGAELFFLDTARRAKSWLRKNLSSDLGLGAELLFLLVMRLQRSARRACYSFAFRRPRERAESTWVHATTNAMMDGTVSLLGMTGGGERGRVGQSGAERHEGCLRGSIK